MRSRLGPVADLVDFGRISGDFGTVEEVTAEGNGGAGQLTLGGRQDPRIAGKERKDLVEMFEVVRGGGRKDDDIVHVEEDTRRNQRSQSTHECTLKSRRRVLEAKGSDNPTKDSKRTREAEKVTRRRFDEQLMKAGQKI